MSRTYCLLLVLFLAGCAAFAAEHSRTILLNQKTGETAECTVDMLRTVVAYERYEACIKANEAKGMTVWSQY